MVVACARLVRSILPVFLCAAAASGCTTTTGPSSTAPFSQTDLTPGTGTEAATGNILSVDYTGWLYDPSKPDHKGLQFDTSIGRSVFTFTLGKGQVIKGWDQGLVGMKVGGIRRLVVPPSLAYGGVRTHTIPPFSTLVFDIQLTDVQTAATSR